MKQQTKRKQKRIRCMFCKQLMEWNKVHKCVSNGGLIR
jgi:hypothetical protein